jgi:5-methylthioadenosine/S-adenosylhomocysteine deaminase
MQQIDTLIHARWIIPVEPDDRVLDNHSLAIHEGRILAILPRQQAEQAYTAQHIQHMDRHVLLPGLINTHTHAAMTLFRGLADDLPLMEWLHQHIWPAEASWVNTEFVHDGSQLAIAEMLRGGTTCFNDMYFFPDEVARVATQSGIRAAIGLIVIDFPTAWAKDADEYLSKGLQLHDRYRNDPLITTVFAPHAPYTVSDQPLQRIQTLAEELDIPIHMHIHETADEINQSLDQHRQRPLQRLEQLGMLTPRLLAVHMTQLEDDEISLLADTGVHVLHCPESNLKLASGFCPVQKLHQAGVNVALGTDGAASNNDLDMFGEMRSAALLAKAVAGDASAIPAATALRMATINGARALGIDDETGSLLPGKAADVIAVQLDDIEASPMYHPLSHIVYACSRDKVSDVWVAGRHLLSERRLTTLDEAAIRQRTQVWQEKIGLSDEKPGLRT